MSYKLEGSYSEADARWQLRLSGEIDISNAHLLKDELEAAYADHGADITIDTADLLYLDSTGLGVIISLYGRLKDDGRKITLKNPRDNVKKLLKVTQFDRILY